jgi:hypothetical protein
MKKGTDESRCPKVLREEGKPSMVRPPNLGENGRKEGPSGRLATCLHLETALAEPEDVRVVHGVLVRIVERFEISGNVGSIRIDCGLARGDGHW